MTPQPGQPVTGSQDSTSSTRPVGACVTATRWRLGKSRRTSHRSQRLSASAHGQLWLGIVEVLEISGGRSPLIIGDLDVYTQLPDPTGAPTLNSEEPVIGVPVVPLGVTTGPRTSLRGSEPPKSPNPSPASDAREINDLRAVIEAAVSSRKPPRERPRSPRTPGPLSGPAQANSVMT